MSPNRNQATNNWSTNNWSSRRQRKIPSKFDDHVMENPGQKRNDTVVQDRVEEIRAEENGLNKGDRENRTNEGIGVFGNRDKELNDDQPADAIKDAGIDSLNDHDLDLESVNCENDKRVDNDVENNVKMNVPYVSTKMNETYVNMVKKDEIPKKLCYKPIEINDNGVEVVIFDELIVKKGCERWNLTFSNIKGLQAVIDKGPWMVNNRPLIRTDGISALASSLGNPLIMDAMTASMCHNGMGRLDFARVLVEMNADKEFKIVMRCNTEIEEVEMEKIRIEEQLKKKNLADNEARMNEKGRNYSNNHNNVRDKGKINVEKADYYKNNIYMWNRFESRKQEYRKKQDETYDQGKEKNEGNDDDLVKIRILKDRMIVDQFINKKIHPTSWNISGMSTKNKQKEVIKFIKEENLQVCAIIKTHIKNIEEHYSGGSFVIDEMQDFKDCINSVEVEDIGSSGFYYTWTISLRNPNNSVLKKLDRIMVSESFLEDFASSQAIFHPFLISDHSPAVLVIPTCGTKKQNLSVEKLRVKLKEIQALVEKSPYDKDIKAKSIKALEEYNVAVKDEENLMAQKARIDWLNDGDKNSAFFHKVIKGRRSRNRVHTIYAENGMNLKEKKSPNSFNTLSPEEATDMIREVTDKEIKDALFDIGDNKAPGPDGYSSVFFKKNLGYNCKILTNRIKSGLKKLVQSNQSALIPRRVIQDNIMLSQEILRGYGRKNDPKRCAMNDAISASIIKDAIKEFSGVSGLLPNLSKSSLFFGSVNEYRGLIDKIKGKTKDWKYKYLSYAGRLMLIAAVLESIIMVTLQKEELKLPGSRFNITSKKDSLWVKRIHEMRLKESSIWNVQWNDVDVWNWKCLLDVRDKISNKLQYEVRNRISVQMWYDRWHNSGLLIDKNWPSDWCRSDFKIMDIRPPKLNTGKQDKVKCRNDNQLIPFYTKLVMKYLSPGYDKVD
ncbi:RNA-directed DNA polymerase, eukaryota, reverse transcriptase zinc-binding domain protein, partial [Tanacetum coccineum]